MKKKIWILIAPAVLFLGAQALNTRPPSIQPVASIATAKKIPDNVKHVVERACKDCHSDETVWPWYSHVYPVSYLIQQDVAKGRKKLNFSKWVAEGAKGPYEDDLDEICAVVKKGKMPPKQYRLMHSEAKLSQEDISAFCSWSAD